MAWEKLGASQTKMKNWYDCRAERQEFTPGVQVLTLKTIVGSPFQAKYTGPYIVCEKISGLNYVVGTSGCRKARRLCHVNLLKPHCKCVGDTDLDQDGKNVVCPALAEVLVQEADGVPEPDESLLSGCLKNSESLCNLERLLAHLPESKCNELSELVGKYPELFGDIPSRTDWIELDIDVGDAEPIKQQFYRMAPVKRSCLDAEVAYMLQNNIAVLSSSSWASLCILDPDQSQGNNGISTTYDIKRTSEVLGVGGIPQEFLQKLLHCHVYSHRTAQSQGEI